MHLEFAWSAGLQVEAEFDRARTRASNGRERTTSAAGRYSLTTEDDPRGLRVLRSEIEFDSSAPLGTLPQRSGAAGQLLRLARARPGYVVDREGRLLEILGLQSLQARVTEAMKPELEALPPSARQAALRLFDPAITVGRLEVRAREQWNRQVEVWHGRTVTDEWQAMDGGRIQLSALPGLPVLVSREARLVGWRPCTPDSPAPTCVELELRSSPDLEALHDALSEYLEERRRDVRGFELELEETLSLLAEPSTLLPASADHVLRWAVTTRPGGKSRKSGHTDRTITRYRLQRR